MKKRIIMFAAVVTLMLAMAACGSTNDSTNTNFDTQEDTLTPPKQVVADSGMEETPEESMDPIPIVEMSNSLEVGKTLDELIDLTAYNEIVQELEEMDDYSRELKDVLPFEIYSIDYNYGLCNIDNMDGTSKTVLSGAIPGEMDSVMVVKMDNASTYDILLRIPYEANDYYSSCFFKDLGNYRVIASDLEKEDVERMVIPGGYLDSSYVDLIYYSPDSYNGEQSLGDFILRQMREPKYLVFNPSNIAYEELTEENKTLLSETSIAYAYFGDYPMPQADEKVTYVETYFNESIENMSLEEVIETIKSYPILGTNELVENPYDTSAH